METMHSMHLYLISTLTKETREYENYATDLVPFTFGRLSTPS